MKFVAHKLACKLCKERGKTWKGDDPKCAFHNKKFDSDNWNCATMNTIRDLAAELGLSMRHNDSSAALIPFDEWEFIVLGWYKNRGQTEYANILGGEPITLDEAESLLKNHVVQYRLEE